MSKVISPMASHPDLLMHPSRINIMAYAENFSAKKKFKLKNKKKEASQKRTKEFPSYANELYESNVTAKMNGVPSKVKLTLNLNKNGVALKNKNLTPRTI